MGKFYLKPNFKALQKEWYEKLADNNFKDQEYRDGTLKCPDRRTKSWESREDILNFFLSFDAYLTHNVIPDKDRVILELYSNGIHTTEIALRLELSRTSIWQVIKIYKKRIIGE